MIIEGLSPDQPTSTNASGGKQSELPYAFHLLPAQSLFNVARVVGEGERKYGEGNWQRITTKSHLNHALSHIYGYLAGDTTDDHLAHAACRLLFAITTAALD